MPSSAHFEEDTIPKPGGLGSAGRMCSAVVQTLFNEPFNRCSIHSGLSSIRGVKWMRL